jgi:hypothetical protein
MPTLQYICATMPRKSAGAMDRSAWWQDKISRRPENSTAHGGPTSHGRVSLPKECSAQSHIGHDGQLASYCYKSLIMPMRHAG